MTLEELLETESLLTESSKSKKAKKTSNDKSESSAKNHDREDRPGRERLITIIFNACTNRGVNVSKEAVRHYVNKKFDEWSSGKEKHLNRLEKNAKSLGFNPRAYRNQKPLQSAGKSNKGQPEYNGRAYYFVSFTNKAVNHFKKINEKKSKKNNNMEK